MATHAKKSEPKADEQDTSGDVELVAVVSRTADGAPSQRPGFVLLLPEDATDEERAAAWNNGGELPPADQPVRYHPRGW